MNMPKRAYIGRMLWTILMITTLVITSCVPPSDSSPAPTTTPSLMPTETLEGTSVPTIIPHSENTRVPPDLTLVKRKPSVYLAIFVPIYMYYLERYFQKPPNLTDTDKQFAAVLDVATPTTINLMKTVLQSYKSMPERDKLTTYDPLILQKTSLVNEVLPIDLVRGRVHDVIPDLVPEIVIPPAAPSDLVAKNVSSFNPDIPGSLKYQIQLDWKDNSDDEAGFLVYRFNATTQGRTQPQPIYTTPPGVTTYTDTLAAPLHNEDQYCYKVLAYKVSPLMPAGGGPTQAQSDATNAACSYYMLGGYPPPPLPIDSDGDGFSDDIDACPYDNDEGAAFTNGCPDDDGDGIVNRDDKCKEDPGEEPVPSDLAPQSPRGCPYQYTLRWMNMKVLSAGTNYEVWKGNKLVEYNNEGNKTVDAWSVEDPFGEEPYLLFEFVNGMLGTSLASPGMTVRGASRWCCGEKVHANSVEPDDDLSGQEVSYLPVDVGILKRGLSVFPEITGQHGYIDDELGIALIATLMERDWTKLVTPEQLSDTLSTVTGSAGVVISAAVTCAGTAGAGCLFAIAGAFKAVVDAVFGWLSSGPTYVEVPDPDDYMGTEVWAINRRDAQSLTVNDGAYAFSFETPTDYLGCCRDAYFGGCNDPVVYPCVMDAVLNFCLVRQGVPEDQIKNVCTPFTEVVPWPQQ